MDTLSFSFERLIQKHQIGRDTVIHIGANFGQEAEIYDRYGFEDVIWIEADPDFCEILKKNVSGRQNHYVIEGLISSDDGRLYDFTRMSNDGSSTKKEVTDLWVSAFSEIEAVSERKLVGHRLDTLLNRMPSIDLLTKRISLLVIDIEGAEMEALVSAGDYLDRVDFAWIEVALKPIFKNGPLYSDISQHMRARGFAPIDAKFGVSSGDVLYKKGAGASISMLTLLSPGLMQVLSATRFLYFVSMAKTLVKRMLKSGDRI